MAASAIRLSRKNPRVDYKKLDALCSIDMYEPITKRSNKVYRSKFYVVERVISKRQSKQGVEYLIKWKDWPMWSCSWEPADNLNGQSIESYCNPTISNDRLERAAVIFLEAVLGILKCKSIRIRFTDTICIDHDIIRFVLKNKGRMAPDKFMLYEKEDFNVFGLPEFWDYYLDVLGQGVKINFPIKLRSKLGFSSKRFVVNDNGALEKGPMIPSEKVIIVVNRRACSQYLL